MDKNLLLLLLAFTVSCCSANVVSVTAKIDGAGVFRFHHDEHEKCTNILILGVGTAMSVSDYDLVSKEIVISSSTKDTIPMWVDPEPDWFIKTNAERFAKLTNAIVDEIMSGNILSFCTGTIPSFILIGGHSAGGEAALKSPPLLKFAPRGFLGLDPYELDPHQDTIDIPSLFWGFAETTCGVRIEYAAKAGYESSNKDHRVLYQIQNGNNNSNSTLTTHHCVFANDGCCACPKSLSKTQQERILAMVGKSSHVFIEAIRHKTFSRNDFELDNEAHQDPFIHLFFNQENVTRSNAIGESVASKPV